MNKQSVLVIMCTYNGERYLEEQIKSVLQQDVVDVSIKVFDDCSTDNTLNILKKYADSNTNFTYSVNKKNKGYSANFLDAIDACKDLNFNYFALSDQDDRWEKNKLFNAIDKIKFSQNARGCLYSSNLKVVDKDLKFIKNFYDKYCVKKNDYGSLISAYYTGCTFVFNKRFAKTICLHKSKNVSFHDYWIALIAIYTADYIYDNNSYISYRQHDSNSVGAKKTKEHNPFERFVKSNFIKEFYEKYKNEIYLDKLPYLELAATYKNSFKKKISLLFCSKIKGRRFIHTLSHKFEVLFNRY